MAKVQGNAAARKEQPIFSGFVKYFPRAMAEVAHLSKVGNDQHNPGAPLHWDRSKSGDELDALSRHLADAGTRDTDGEWHDTKVAWRAMANLEKLLEKLDTDAQEEAAHPPRAALREIPGEKSSYVITHDGKPVDPYYDHFDGPLAGPAEGAGGALASGGEILPEVSEDAPTASPVAARASLNIAGVGDLTFEIFAAEGQTSDGPAADAYVPEHTQEQTPEPDAIMLRKTSDDKPQWQTFQQRIDAAVQKYGR